MEDTQLIFEEQNVFIIENLVKYKGYSKEQAFKIWYASKTKSILQDSSNGLEFVSKTRCYDEILMELENHRMWMKGSFV